MFPTPQFVSPRRHPRHHHHRPTCRAHHRPGSTRGEPRDLGWQPPGSSPPTCLLGGLWRAGGRGRADWRFVTWLGACGFEAWADVDIPPAAPPRAPPTPAATFFHARLPAVGRQRMLSRTACFLAWCGLPPFLPALKPRHRSGDALQHRRLAFAGVGRAAVLYLRRVRRSTPCTAGMPQQLGLTTQPHLRVPPATGGRFWLLYLPSPQHTLPSLASSLATSPYATAPTFCTAWAIASTTFIFLSSVLSPFCLLFRSPDATRHAPCTFVLPH